MKRLAFVPVLLTIAAGAAFAQDTSPRRLEYDYRTMKLKICDGSAAAPDCEDYLASKRFFPAGDVVRLVIVDYPLLSAFQVKVDDQVINIVQPFIHGVSDAEAPATGGNAAAGGGKLLLFTATSSVIDRQRPGIRKGEQAALDAAVKQLRDTEAGLTATIERTLTALFEHPTPNAYPGPSWEDAKAYAASLLGDWKRLPVTGQIKTAAFQDLAQRTELLINTVRDLNARVKKATQATSLPDLRAKYQSLVLDASTVLEDALQAPAFKAAATAAVSPRVAPVTDPVASFLAAQKLTINPAPYLTGNPAAELQYAADLVRASSGPLLALDKAGVLPEEVANAMAEIFARANQLYVSVGAKDPQVLTIGQWTGSHALKIDIQETKGFTPFAFATAVSGGDGQSGAGASPAASDTDSTAVDLTPGTDETAAQKPQPKKKAPKPDPPADPAPANPPPDATAKTVFQFGVNVHQISRGNLVSGFARSRLHTTEYTLKDVPVLDDAGKPVKDTDGKPMMAKTPVLARDDPRQYLYYVGLNFYLKPHDLFPGAMRAGEYWIPGLMFAYGVTDDANFLVGLNWETSWGLNVGGGVHYGKETVLSAAYTTPGVQLPSSTTSAPTTTQFNHELYFNVGFDASVFQKVFGAVKGVKSGS